MDPLEALKKALNEALNEEQTKPILESLATYKTKVENDAKAAIVEAVQEQKVKLETDYLAKLEAAKQAGDNKIREEVNKFEKQLAGRVKTILESALNSHGDRLVRIAEQTEAKRGTALLTEVENLVSKAKAEITESVKVDPKEVEKLKGQIKTLNETVSTKDKLILEHKARANVAEGTVRELRESLDTSLTVTVTESEKTLTKPAGEQHPDSTNAQPIVEDENGGGSQQPKWSPAMERMRKRAGVKPATAKA